MNVDAAETCRQLVIAKMGRLKVLDRLEVSNIRKPTLNANKLFSLTVFCQDYSSRTSRSRT